MATEYGLLAHGVTSVPTGSAGRIIPALSLPDGSIPTAVLIKADPDNADGSEVHIGLSTVTVNDLALEPGEAWTDDSQTVRAMHATQFSEVVGYSYDTLYCIGSGAGLKVHYEVSGFKGTTA